MPGEFAARAPLSSSSSSSPSVINNYLSACLQKPVNGNDGHKSSSSSHVKNGSYIVDQALVNNARGAMMSAIDFVKADAAAVNAFSDSLKSKYINLTSLAVKHNTLQGSPLRPTVSLPATPVATPVTKPPPQVSCSENRPAAPPMRLPSTSTLHNGNGQSTNGKVETNGNGSNTKGKVETNGKSNGLSEPTSDGPSDHSKQVQPKQWLYPIERIQLAWCRLVPVGVGLINCGNTCFLNSTLQALTHTAPLYNFLVTEQHDLHCRNQGFCMLCEMQHHMVRNFANMNTNRAMEPTSILHKLHIIAKHLHLGRQEDAHEFLRFAVEKMQQACLYGLGKLDPEIKETTAINAIFGGSLRSTVTCQMCQSKSEKFDPILDLSLDLRQATSLQMALANFIRAEQLTGENAYKCTQCKRQGAAWKVLGINRAPNVLTVQLKRFGNSHFGGSKITRPIEFDELLNLRPFMTVTKGAPVCYSLYAIVVHEGLSANSGHYYAYAKHNSQWYMLNDTVVKAVGQRQAISSQAYLLFYIRDTAVSANGVSLDSTSATASFPRPVGVSSADRQPASMAPKPNGGVLLKQNQYMATPTKPPQAKIFVNLQNGNKLAANGSASAGPKIITHTNVPLVQKKPAQPNLQTTSLVKQVLIPTATTTASPIGTVEAIRPLVEANSSDDEDDEKPLVIDEIGVSRSMSSRPSRLSTNLTPVEVKKDILAPIPKDPPLNTPARCEEPRVEKQTDSSSSAFEATPAKKSKLDEPATETSTKVLTNGDLDAMPKSNGHDRHNRHDRHHHRHSSRKHFEDGEVSSSPSASKASSSSRSTTPLRKARNDDDSLSSSSSRHKHHHGKRKDHTPRDHTPRGLSEKKQKIDEEEDDEWVEKVQPSQVANKLPSSQIRPPTPPRPSPLAPAPVGSFNPTAAWSLGPQVTSWDGHLNSIDAASAVEAKSRRSENDDLDAEFDTGRTSKKSKSFKDEFEMAASPPKNQFQAAQDSKNAQRVYSNGSQQSNGTNGHNGYESNRPPPVSQPLYPPHYPLLSETYGPQPAQQNGNRQGVGEQSIPANRFYSAPQQQQHQQPQYQRNNGYNNYQNGKPWQNHRENGNSNNNQGGYDHRGGYRTGNNFGGGRGNYHNGNNGHGSFNNRGRGRGGGQYNSWR